MNDIDKRKAFQRAKQMTNEQFWNWMSWLHTKAYAAGVKHYTEAAEIVLTPKEQKLLHEKATEIRELWDGMSEITMSDTEAIEFDKVMNGGKKDGISSTQQKQ